MLFVWCFRNVLILNRDPADCTLLSRRHLLPAEPGKLVAAFQTVAAYVYGQSVRLMRHRKEGFFKWDLNI